MGAEQQSTGVSRRDLIKKAAVAGGVAWVAPTVLANPAFAANPCGCSEGANGQLFGIKFQEGSSTCASPGANASGEGNCGAIDGITNFRDGCCLVTAGIVSAPVYSGGAATITLGPGVSLCKGFSKCGPNCLSSSAQVSTTPGDNGTTIVRFDCDSAPQGGLSHLELFVCVNGTASPGGGTGGVVGP